MAATESDAAGETPPNHVIIKVPAGGKETAKQALSYRVGPACNWAFFYTRRSEKLVLWGEHLDETTLRRLGNACHELQQEHADMAMYDAAKGADRMEGKFVFADTPYLDGGDA